MEYINQIKEVIPAQGVPEKTIKSYNIHYRVKKWNKERSKLSNNIQQTMKMIKPLKLLDVLIRVCILGWISEIDITIEHRRECRKY